MRLLTTPNILKFLVALTLFQAIVNGFFIVDKVRSMEEMNAQKKVVVSTKDSYQTLQSKYKEIDEQIGLYKNKNEQYDKLFDVQKEELENRKQKIETLLKNTSSKGNTTAQTVLVEDELKELEALKDKFTRAYQEINNQNLEIKKQSELLTKEYNYLGDNTKYERKRADSLEQSVSTLATEKAKLEANNEMLYKHLNSSLVLKVKDIEIKPTGMKDDGGDKKTKQANKTDKIEICFNLIPNELVAKNKEAHFIRIISPQGVLLTDENQGSATFRESLEGKVLQYSLKQTIEYVGLLKKICSYWQAPGGLPSGTYQIEIFNKGFLAGKSRFTLR